MSLTRMEFCGLLHIADVIQFIINAISLVFLCNSINNQAIVDTTSFKLLKDTKLMNFLIYKYN